MNLLQNRYFQISVVSLLLLGAGYGIGRFAQPAKVITKVETHEVIKEVQVKEQKKDIKKVVTVITHPDGTKESTTTTEDKTITDTNTKIDATKDAKSETITVRDIGLSVQALALTKFNDVNNREYGVLVKKRIVSNISASVIVTQGQIGVGVGLDF
jgi:hypothetical protein